MVKVLAYIGSKRLVVIESDGFEPATGIPIDPIEKIKQWREVSV
jgi:hypothetical protein